MGIKDNFSQAMKELVNPKESDQRKEVKDVAAYMNDTADAGQPTPNPAPQAQYSYQQSAQGVNSNTANSGFSQNGAQDMSQRIARDMNEQNEQGNMAWIWRIIRTGLTLPIYRGFLMIP